jgi:hypothetical protein
VEQKKSKFGLLANKKNVINMGKLKLQQELQLISNLDVMLSMAWNAHIIAMLWCKSHHALGATHPYAGFSPFNQPLENALVSDRNHQNTNFGMSQVGYQEAMRTIR